MTEQQTTTIDLAALTPIDRAALALVPLFVRARAEFDQSRSEHSRVGDNAICDAFEALTRAADEVSYRLLRKAGWADGEGARDLMNEIDEATAELRAIDRGEPLPVREG